MRKVPQRLFEDTETWTMATRELLDKFDANVEVPNYINYDMLEPKDPNSFDTIAYGEALLVELDQHKEVDPQRTQLHIDQLGLKFNNGLIRQLKDIASCNRIDDVPIDENELTSMADLISETHKA
jgi:hypothetical protein